MYLIIFVTNQREMLHVSVTSSFPLKYLKSDDQENCSLSLLHYLTFYVRNKAIRKDRRSLQGAVSNPKHEIKPYSSPLVVPSPLV